MNINSVATNWLWAVVVLPVIAGIFKSEIGKFFTAWNVYRLRSFDVDGNPATSDEVEIFNGATGKWGKVEVKIRFSMSSRIRGAYIYYPGGELEKVSLIEWAKFRKRQPKQCSKNG